MRFFVKFLYIHKKRSGSIPKYYVILSQQGSVPA